MSPLLKPIQCHLKKVIVSEELHVANERYIHGSKVFTSRRQIGPGKSACRLKNNSEVNSGEFVPNRRILRHYFPWRSMCLRPGIA